MSSPLADNDVVKRIYDFPVQKSVKLFSRSS